MARHGTVKRLADNHETHIAALYDGIKSPSSGGAASDAGDVRTDTHLIECKLTGTPGVKPKRIPKMIQELEKIADEAHAEGRDPILCLRYYHPDSRLANRDGWLDLSVKLTTDDVNG